MLGRAQAELAFRRLFQFPDRDAGHAINDSIDVNDIFDCNDSNVV